MKFSCERCHTSQTIADAGAEGAVARCQHCGHVNQVEVGGVSSPSAPGAKGADPDLEEEIGAAFDSMFGEGEEREGEEAAAGSGARADAAGAAVAVGEGASAYGSVPAASGGSDGDPAGFEWYVAIDGKQVGPVSFADLKERWARSIIDSDSLCWRMHFSDWLPIGDVPSLLEALGGPVRAPRGEAPAGRQPVDLPVADLDPADQPEEGRAAGSVDKGGAKAGFQPTAASDLSALVQGELEQAKQREAEAASDPMAGIPDPETTGVRVLIRNLPEAPPPEPSKFIPIAKDVPAPVVRERVKAPAPAAQGRQRVTGASKPKSGGKGVAIAAVVVLLLGGGAAAAHFAGLLDPILGGGAAGSREAGEALAAARPAVAEEAPAPVAKQEAIPPAESDQEAAAQGEGGAAPEEVAKADGEEGADEAQEQEGGNGAAAAAAAEAPQVAEPVKVAKAPEVKAPPRSSRTTQRAAPTPVPVPATSKAPPPPATRAQAKAPQAAPKPAGGDLLAAGKSNSIDALFEQEMAAPAPVRKEANAATYIPPPPGAGAQKPRALGQGEIMGVVAAQKADLRTCANRYKEQGGSTGSVVMSWAIEPNGRTSAIRAVRGQEHAPMVSCLTGLIKDWRFPEYAGPKMAPIEFPFQF